MSQSTDPQPTSDWHCGGWEGAELTTLRHMASLTFTQKVAWLEQAQRIVASLHGWDAALQPSGSIVVPHRQD